MLLKILKSFKTVEEAAKEMAGNWERWNHFVWFGSNEFPNSDKIMLGYLTGPESGLRDLANARTVMNVLKPYMGMADDHTKTADSFGSSFWGDTDALAGCMVRVHHDDGTITEAFEKLYNLASDYIDEVPLCEETYNAVNREMVLAYVTRHLEYWCRTNKIEYSTQLSERVTDYILEDDTSYDDVTEDMIESAVADVRKWKTASV